MSDIVERLRISVEETRLQPTIVMTRQDAAQLLAEIERLRAALKAIADYPYRVRARMQELAREALDPGMR